MKPTQIQRQKVAEACKHYRQVWKLSQEDIARICKCSDTTISGIENCNELHSLKTLRKVWEKVSDRPFPRKDIGARRNDKYQEYLKDYEKAVSMFGEHVVDIAEKPKHKARIEDLPDMTPWYQLNIGTFNGLCLIVSVWMIAALLIMLRVYS